MRRTRYRGQPRCGPSCGNPITNRQEFYNRKELFRNESRSASRILRFDISVQAVQLDFGFFEGFKGGLQMGSLKGVKLRPA